MKIVRTTVVRPLPGRERKVAALLDELSAHLAQQPGFIEAYVLGDEEEKDIQGHIRVWSSREAADRAASLVHTIALRAKLHARTLPIRQDSLLRVDQEHHIEAPAATR